MISSLFTWLANRIGQIVSEIFSGIMQALQRFTVWLAGIVQYVLDWITTQAQNVVDWFWSLSAKCIAWLADLFIGNNPDVAYNVVSGVNYMRTALERWNEFLPVHEIINLAGIYVGAYITIKAASVVWRIILAVLP